MPMKKENPLSKKRTKLLGFLQKLKISTSTKLKIGRMLDNMTDEQAEEKANQILTAIISCKNESDVLTKLSIQ